MASGRIIVSIVCFAALIICGLSLRVSTKPLLFGTETIRRRLTLPHWLVMFGALGSLGMVYFKTWFTVLKPYTRTPLQDLDYLSLGTVLVLCMLFGFVAFEAGTVSSAYRNESCQKNLLVIMFSLASYLGIGRFIYASFYNHGTVAKMMDEPTSIVFQAAFACTVSLIISNALTERASTPTNVLCAIVSAGLAYPILAGLVWGNAGALLHDIGFIDASGASTVHLLGAAASLTAAAAVGPRVRIQKWQFLGSQETPDFSSPWTVVGGLFLMFGWLGFNGGNAEFGLGGQAFFNTTIGACSGALAAWLLSRGLGAPKRWILKLVRTKWKYTYLKLFTGDGGIRFQVITEELEARPRIVIGMMGGLVAVTANGALQGVKPHMAAIESFAGGLVAVVVSSWMSARSRSEQIDDPLGVIGTHGGAAIVGILSTAFWLAPDRPFWRQFIAQLIGSGACIVVGWLVAMVPCLLLLTSERRALVSNRGSWIAAKFRLRLGAIAQLGPTRETPLDLEWNDRIEEARHCIMRGLDGQPDKWWGAVEVYATATEMLDKSSQADIAHRIVEKFPETAGWYKREKAALVALGSSAGRAEDISSALEQSLRRASNNGNGHASTEELDRREMLVWSVALLTERAAASAKAARPEMPAVLARAHEGLDFLRKVTKGNEDYKVRDLARIGVIDSSARLFDSAENTPQIVKGPFDPDGEWQTVHAVFTNEATLALLFFLADHSPAMIATATDKLSRTREDTLEAAMILASHGLISCDTQKLTIKDDGFLLVNRLRHGVRG